MVRRQTARLVLGAVCVGVMAIASVVTASSASADSSLTWYKIPGIDRYAHASFKSYGEVFSVSDDEPDGASVRIFWYYAGSSIVQGFCTNSSGNGTTKTCNFSIPEGRRIGWCLERIDFSNSHLYTYKCTSDTA